MPLRLCLGMLVAALLSVVSLQGEKLEDDFLVTVYSVEDGLPQNSVIDVAQTADGYLWVATYGGLTRFDGLKFTSFDTANTPALSRTGVFMMHLDRSGRLWIVTDDWRVTWNQNGIFERCSGRFGLPDVGVTFNGESPDGRVVLDLAAGGGAGFSFDGHSFSAGQEGHAPPPHYAGALAADQSGSVWFQSGQRWVRMSRGDLRALLPRTNGAGVVRIARPARDGGVWVATSEGVHKWSGGKWTKFLAAPSPLGSSTAMLEDGKGAIWIATWKQGLWRIDRQGTFHQYATPGGGPNEAIRAIFEDREGNLWVGAEGTGLLRLRPRFCRAINEAQGLSGDLIRSIARDSHDNVWAVSQSALNRIEAGASGRVQRVADVDLGWAVACDNRDRIWVGTYGGKLLLERNGELVAQKGNNELPITSLLAGRDGRLWIGTPHGLWVRTDEGMTRVSGPLGTAALRGITEDGNGIVYAGASTPGLWCWTNHQWINFELKLNPDLCPLAADGGALWMAGADRGLLRLSGNGVCRIESETVGLPRVLTCLARDDLGFAWFGSPQGIYRAPAAELNALADGRGEAPTAIRYGRGDGLLTAECTSGHQPSVCKTSDGRLWFATTRGVAVIDPAALSTNQYAPPVQIEQAQIFGEHGSVMTTNVRGGKLRIGPGARRVEISYAAPSYTAPERLRFRYRLEGSRDDWTEAGSRRVAYYEGLEPGDYLFRVIAGNTDGPWNENGATLGFRIEARFWQTRWFKVLVAATGVALAWGMFLLRLAQVNEVNRLRLRIARDLHDEIGANLGSIGLNTELLMSDATVGEQHRRDLAGIDQLTAQTAQSVREIVWMTNPEFDSLDGMLRRMRELATLMLAGRQWTFEAPGSGSSKALPLEVRRNMFFAFKECLHNVVKHSSATRVSIVARVEASWIEVTVEDNGAGFDPAAAKTSGTGLRSMRRRMEELGGAAEVRSANGGGAQIRLRASLRRTGAWRRWWAPPE